MSYVSIEIRKMLIETDAMERALIRAVRSDPIKNFIKLVNRVSKSNRITVILRRDLRPEDEWRTPTSTNGELLGAGYELYKQGEHTKFITHPAHDRGDGRVALARMHTGTLFAHPADLEYTTTTTPYADKTRFGLQGKSEIERGNQRLLDALRTQNIAIFPLTNPRTY